MILPVTVAPSGPSILPDLGSSIGSVTRAEIMSPAAAEARIMGEVKTTSKDSDYVSVRNSFLIVMPKPGPCGTLK